MDYRYNRFERFCARHEKWGIKNLMLYITAANIIVFLFCELDLGFTILLMDFSFMPSQILKGEIWRIFTFMFVPVSDNIFGLALTSIFYYFIGKTLEEEWGRLKFNIFIFFGAFTVAAYAGIMSFWFGDLVWFYTNSGIHYLFMSMFIAYAILEPDAYLRLFFLIPIKVKWLAIIDLVYIVVGIFKSPLGLFGALLFFPLNLMPLVALLNVALFFGGRFISHFRSNVRARKFSHSNRVDFQKKVKEIKKRGYTHRCVVCGKTDVTHPNEEFRYCSKCAGYACYCSEHIMDHTHIK